MLLVVSLATVYFVGSADPIPVDALIQADALKAASVRLGHSDTHSCTSTPDMSDDAAAEIAKEISQQCVDLGFALPCAY